jgi:beta-galactosidase
VTVACDRIIAEPLSMRVRPEFLAELDVVGYNYADRWRNRRELYYSSDHDAFPDRPVIGTESSSIGGTRGDASALAPGKSPNLGRSIDVEQLWKFVNDYDYVSGDHMWTGIDYLGEGTWPIKGLPSGQIDSCGFVKDGYYFYQSQWTANPVLHLFPHWNWPGSEGKTVPVQCYTNCDTVELFLNGTSLGVKGYEYPRIGMQDEYGTYPPRALETRTTADLHLSWDVPYAPGTLKAVGSRLGKVVSTTEVVTTGAPVAVKLSVDRTAIAADRRDVCHVTAAIVDADGRTVPTAANAVTFSFQGPTRLIGVDNGDPANHDSYQVNKRVAFNGLCLAIAQSTAKAGQVTVLATAPGLASGTAHFSTN